MVKPSAAGVVPAIDSFDLARSRSHLEGHILVSDLPRLAEATSDSAGNVHYAIDGLIDDNGHAGATLHLRTELRLICQRCNEPMTLCLDQTTRFRFVRSEEELNAMPIEDDEVDAIVGSPAMNVRSWIEDEVILSLPLVPRHENCSPALRGEPDTATSTEQETNPFRALAALKRNEGGPPH